MHINSFYNVLEDNQLAITNYEHFWKFPAVS